MKFISTAFALVALLPSVFGQTLFEIGGGAFSGDWATYKDDTNQVTITYNLQGESTNDFNVVITKCGTSSAEYTFTPGTQNDGSSTLVTFTNTEHVVGTKKFCIDVALHVNSITAAVATKTFEYDVTVTGSGSGTVNVDSSTTEGVEVNTIAADTSSEAGSFTVAHTPFVSTVGNIKFGQSFRAEIPQQSGFSFDITAVSVGTVGAGQEAPSPTDFGANEFVDITLPLSSFLDGVSKTTVQLTVAWVVTNTVRRRGLRALQEGESGTLTYDVDVDIVPLEDGSYAYTYKVASISSMAAAGAVALLL